MLPHLAKLALVLATSSTLVTPVQSTRSRPSHTIDDTCPECDAPVVLGCRLERRSSGVFQLAITGLNFKQGAIATVRGERPGQVVFKRFDPETNSFSRLILKKGTCSRVPGVIVVTNPGPDAVPSIPFQCNERCPN